MNIVYTLSQSALDAEYIATGKRGNPLRTLAIADEDLTPDQRSVIVANKEAVRPAGFSANRITTYYLDLADKWRSWVKPHVQHLDLQLDATPSVDEVIEHIARMGAEYRAAEELLPGVLAQFELNAKIAQLNAQIAALRDEISDLEAERAELLGE